jgi:hypothetical protein
MNFTDALRCAPKRAPSAPKSPSLDRFARAMRQTRLAKRFAALSGGRRLGVIALAILVGLGLTAVWAVPTPHASRIAAAQVPLPAPGADASWPVCKHPATYGLPADPAFAIIGINDGEPGPLSACLARELAWAAGVPGGSTQPDLAYYVMAADPFSPYESRWTKPIWPKTNLYHGVRVSIPPAYGTGCTGSHTSAACAYVFGWTAAFRDAHLPGLVDAATTHYWIDVEAPRDWSTNPSFNEAIVEGMQAYFTTPIASGGLGTTAGLYSTPDVWAQIVGDVRTGSPLPKLDEWTSIGDGDEVAAAAALATPEPLLYGARVTMVQYWIGDEDWDYAPAAK